jgi:hypothetical protein
VTSKIQFRASVLDDFATVSEHAELRITDDDGGWINLMLRNGAAEVTGSSSIVIRPLAGNVVTVRPARYDER